MAAGNCDKNVVPCALQFMVSPLNHPLSDFGQGPIRPLTHFSSKEMAKRQRISLVHSISSSQGHQSSGLSCFRAFAIHPRMYDTQTLPLSHF